MALPQLDERPRIDLTDLPVASEIRGIPETPDNKYRIGAYTISTIEIKPGPYTCIHKVLGVEGKPQTRVTALEILDPDIYLTEATSIFEKLAKVLHIRVRDNGKFWYMVHLTPFEELEPIKSLIYRENR